MATAIYTLVVGILISLDGIILLIFDIEGFSLPNWYIGIMLVIGVVGIILGIISINKKSAASGRAEPVNEKGSSEEEVAE